MKRLFTVPFLCLFALTASSQLKYGKTVTISKPVFEDLYITAGNIIINAPVYGDLVAAGGTIQVNDTIANDILVAGGTISFNGFVGDDIRCAGGKLQVMKPVKGTVVATGGTVEIERGINVGALLVSGGEVVVNGIVDGNIRSMSGKLEFNGIAMKDLDCRGGDILIDGEVKGNAVLVANEGVTIGSEAVFEGTVRYWTPDKNVDFKQSVKNGRPVYDPALRIENDRWYFLGFASVLGLLWYAGMALILIMVIQYLFSTTMKNAGTTAYDAALKSLGYGILFWVGVPAVAAVVMITVVGLPVGLILLGCYVILALMATVIAAVVSANWLNSRSNAYWSYWRLVFAAFGIFVLFKILTFTPFLGWFIMAVLVCISFGAIILNIKWRRRMSAGK